MLMKVHKNTTKGVLIGFQDLNLFRTPKNKQHSNNKDKEHNILSWLIVN